MVIGGMIGGGGGLTPALEALINGAIQSTEKGAINGVTPLDANKKVPLINLPNNLKEIKIVDTITDRDNIIVGDRFEGLYVLVKNAIGDPSVNSGWATYILQNGLLNSDWFKINEGESIDLILSALNTSYDNTISLLTATTVQDAIDELETKKEDKSNKNQANGYSGLDVDNSVLATQLDKPILNFLPTIFYSFEIALGAAIFDNTTNTINKNDLLLCTESDGSLTFNKGTLYQIDTTTATPTTAMLNSFLTPAEMVGKQIILHRDFNNYPKGNYTANDTQTDLENYLNTANPQSLITLQENLKMVGFVNKDDTTLSWNDTNRTITLTINNATEIYINSKLYNLAVGSFTKQISNTEGQHYIYFNVDVNDNVIIEETTSFTEDLIVKYCIIAYCYFDATNSKAILGLQDERHGMTMDCATHLYLHNTIGTAYQSGLLPSVIANGDGSNDTHIQMAGASGIIEDEDLKHIIPSRLATDNITIIYREGSNGNWRENVLTNKIAIPTGTGRASYNQNNAGVWQLTEIANNDFGICYAFVCPSIDNTKKWFIVLGTESYNNVNNARKAASELPNLGVLPFKEYKLVAGVIYQTSNSYTNSVKSKIVTIDGTVSFIDFRTSTSSQNAPINANDIVNLQNQIDLKQNNITKVANQTTMLALSTAIVGDIVIRADDNNYLYRLNTLPASNLSNWEVLGKDAQPVGETVEDIITTNEVITSKVNGLYAFTGTPNGGFPAGVTQGDIAEKDANVWTVVYTFINAPASIYSKSDGQTYDKKVNSSNVNNWLAKPKPTYYEIGSNKEFSTINSAFAQFIIDAVAVGTGQLYDSEINERAIFPANAQNFLLKGEGYVTRNNNLVNNFEILGHRFTLQKCQPNCNASLVDVARTVTTTLNSKNIVITGSGQTTVGFVKYQKITGIGIPPMSYVDTIVNSTTFTISQNATASGANIATTVQPKAPVVIDSSGTITENSVPNVKRGKHAFDDISFSTPGASALDIFDIGNWADFRNCNFSDKEINLYTASTTPVYITFTNCQQGVINIYSPFIVVTKAYSPSVIIKTIINQAAIIDFDKATPVAYSILRQYSLGKSTSIPLGAMIINDDLSGNLANLKCTTAYTIAVTPTTGTPIDLTKYQIQTDTTREAVANKVSTFTATPNNTNYPTEKLVKDNLDLKQNITDNTLNTTSKTIVGGINELKTSVDGKVVDAINDGVTSTAPSQNAVFDALILKANENPNKKVFANQTTNFTISQADIDNYGAFEFNQTTAGVIISLSTPTGNSGKPILFKNTGTATINLIDTNSPIAITKMSIASFNGTSWNIVAGGSSSSGFSVIADTTTTTLNLNTVTATVITNYSALTSLTNGPTGIVPTVGKLITVENYYATNGIEQNLLLNDNKYFRSYINSVWSSWQLIATVDTTPNSNIIDGLTTPPVSPSNGDAYVMLANPTGAWSTFAQGSIATYNESTVSWVNTIPVNGTAITFSNPVNLNGLNSYYIAGQTYKYNSAWGSPVIAGLLWQLYVASSQFQPYNNQAVSISVASNVATVTCPQNHNLAVGYSITISSSPNAAFNETVIVTAIVNPLVFRYAKVLANTTTTGTLTATTQLLPSGCTSVLVPSTISFNVIIAVAAGSYSSSASFVCTNLRSAPCYVAGIPIGKFESVVLIPNSTSQWQSADTKYEILKFENPHGFTNAFYQNKVIANRGTGDTNWSLVDGGDLSKVITGKLVLNVIDANNILVANSGKITTFVPHGLLPNVAYSYGNSTTGSIGNLVDGTTLTTGHRANNTLVNYLNAYQFDWYPDKQFSPVIPSISTALQTEAYNKQFAVIEGLGSTVISPSMSTGVNNIISLPTTTSIKIAGLNGLGQTIYVKFSGQTTAIKNINDTFTVSQIPVFGLGGNANPTNPNPNLDPAIKNINSYGNGGSSVNFILAINSAGTLFAIPYLNYTDAITDISTLTSGQIGFQLNPLKAYRHNGTQIELYDFVLMGIVSWNALALSQSVINGITIKLNTSFNRGLVEGSQSVLANSTKYNFNLNFFTKKVHLISFIECKVAELTYTVGDRLYYNGDGTSGIGTGWYGLLPTVNDDKQTISLTTGNAGFNTINKTTGGSVQAFTTANWSAGFIAQSMW